jgi:TorA maturation chaperone TorD
MPRETLSARIARLEELHADLAATVKILQDAQVKTETRFQEMDDHIGKLVSAIGELIRRMPAK